MNCCPNLNLARKLKGFATREYLYYVCKSEDFRNSFNNVKPIYSILRDLLNKPSKDSKSMCVTNWKLMLLRMGNIEKPIIDQEEELSCIILINFET